MNEIFYYANPYTEEKIFSFKKNNYYGIPFGYFYAPNYP
ncbi:hypothetical protein FDG46_04985 [Clostridium botulinum]|nr:hypothetical protein CLB_2808 [Clostridium botulinum A str. ATCC 19397]ABS36010.1 hypothetical protein CLC_2741 [Clostridium botulinum A str. Hall]AWB18655.1 hypothetical protein DB732_14530 [Clostridium botulinum]EGT5616590.1 hypothetical protein [Clostridium botulinum]EGT5621146.1 hypothetical protein [Clostridium botulinum]